MKRSLIIIAPLLLAGAARAQIVVYTDLTPNTYVSSSPWVFSKGAKVVTEGFEFDTTGAGTLTTIDVAVANTSGSNVVTAQLFTNASGNTGSLLATSTADAAGSPGSLLAMNFTGGPSLSSGTDYWLVLSTASASTDDWFENGNGITGNHITTGPTVPSGLLGAFDVKVAGPLTTPEPAPLLALGLGVIGLIRLRRRA